MLTFAFEEADQRPNEGQTHMATPAAFSLSSPAVHPATTSGRSSATTWIVEIGAIMAAAIRAARAVESRREPAAADLKTLGVVGPLPKRW